jgi:predicted permease
MELYLVILRPLAVVLLCIVGGAALRRFRYLTPEADVSLFNLVVVVFWPCLIVDKVLGSPAVRDPGNLLWAATFGFAAVAGGIGLARGLARWTPIKDSRGRRTFAVTTGIFNYGFIPLPLILMLFDDEAVTTLFIHNLGVELALWTVGVTLLSGALTWRGLRRAMNPPFFAVTFSILLTLPGWEVYVPGVLRDAAHFLGLCCVPIALLLTGATMFDEHETSPTALLGREGVATSAWACGLRLALIPILMVVTAGILPLSEPLLKVVAVTASMGSGLFPLVLARHYGGDPNVAFRVIFATAALSFLTCPLAMRLAFWWLGIVP